MMAAQSLPPVDRADAASVKRTLGAMDAGIFGGGKGAGAMLLIDVESWIAAAPAGAELVYATGMGLPIWAKGPKLMREMAEAGVVILFVERPARGVRDYIARRTGKPLPGALPTKADPEKPPRADDETRMLELLAELAADGRPCPPNPELARRLELRDAARASYLLGCLETSGAITREVTAWMPGRIIVIEATGESTGVVEGVRR